MKQGNPPSESRPALACVPGAIPAEERPAHAARVRRLFEEAALETQRSVDGYAFRFAREEIEELGRFVARERKCCPFLAFAIEVAADDGPVWLRLAGPPGSHEVVEAELLREPLI